MSRLVREFSRHWAAPCKSGYGRDEQEALTEKKIPALQFVLAIEDSLLRRGNHEKGEIQPPLVTSDAAYAFLLKQDFKV